MFQTAEQIISQLKAAVKGHELAHGVPPAFILMSADMGRALRDYLMIVPSIATPGQETMKLFDIEIGQIAGSSRVELVADLEAFKKHHSAS